MSDVTVTVYTSEYCGYCWRAKSLLEAKGIVYEEVSVDKNPSVRGHMQQMSGRTSVPQIWIGEMHIGGCSELYSLESTGKLDGFFTD